MALLQVPADCVRYLMENVFGETDADLYEQTSWDEAKAAQEAAGMIWAVRYVGGTFSQFVKLVSRQSNADLFQSAGLWVYRWRTRREPSASFTVNKNLTALPVFTRTPPRTSLVAKLSTSWDPNYVTNEWRQNHELTSAVSGRIGAAQRGRRVDSDYPFVLELPYVNDTATANLLSRLTLPRVDRQRWGVHLESDWDAIAIEKGDTITVESELLRKTFGSAQGTFVVTEKAYSPEADAIVLDAEQTDPASLELSLAFSILAATTRALSLTFAIKPIVMLPLTFDIITIGEEDRGLTFRIITDGETAELDLTFRIAHREELELTFDILSLDDYFGGEFFGPTYFGGAYWS